MLESNQPYVPSVAKATDWRSIKPMPAEHAMVTAQFGFADEQMVNIRLGFIPEEMGDKWFIYVDDRNVVRFHRSWTGYCVYQIQLIQSIKGWIASEFCVNRNPDQYSNTDDVKDQDLLTTLFRNYLVRPRLKPESQFIVVTK